MKSIVRGGGLVIGAALLLGGCGSFGGKGENGPASSAAPAPTSDLAVDTHPKLGDPYTIGGVTYTPADVADYDDVGYASWYGEELGGRPTASLDFPLVKQRSLSVVDRQRVPFLLAQERNQRRARGAAPP